MKNKKLSRRNFLGQASCAAVGSTAFLNSVLNLGMINTLAARPHIIGSSNDYKAMVCILLAGGADTFNVLVPTETSEYADYLATRGSLALDINASPAELVDLNYNNAGRTFAVHSGLSDLKDLFDDGDLSFLSNVGSLIEPIANKSEYESGMKNIPLGLFSHSDQIMQWQTSVPQSRSAVGVAGRMADLLMDMNTIDQVSMNISLDGRNRFQAGNQVVEYALSNTTDENNIGFDGEPYWKGNSGFLNMKRKDAIQSMAESVYDNIFQQTFGTLTGQTIESSEYFKVALGNVTPLSTQFSPSGLSQDLKKIAELMSVRSFLGANRQIFFTTYGGWDHHDDVKTNQENMLPVINDALKEFNAAMAEIGLKDDVITFTISDFARTLTSNGNGSDHAWGGNQIIMGGPINGGDIFGNYPSLSLLDTINVSDRGRLIPTTSVDEFYAEIALWFGASPNDLDYILPNLCNFYSSSCPEPPPGSYAPIGMFV